MTPENNIPERTVGQLAAH